MNTCQSLFRQFYYKHTADNRSFRKSGSKYPVLAFTDTNRWSKKASKFNNFELMAAFCLGWNAPFPQQTSGLLITLRMGSVPFKCPRKGGNSPFECTDNDESDLTAPTDGIKVDQVCSALCVAEGVHSAPSPSIVHSPTHLSIEDLTRLWAFLLLFCPFQLYGLSNRNRSSKNISQQWFSVLSGVFTQLKGLWPFQTVRD